MHYLTTIDFKIEVINNGYIVYVVGVEQVSKPIVSQYCANTVEIGNFISRFLSDEGILPNHDIY